jgi:hypothetical protein
MQMRSHADVRAPGTGGAGCVLMRDVGSLLFHGQVVLAYGGAGRATFGPPATPDDQVCAVAGFVPPATVETGLASLVLRWLTARCGGSAPDAGWLAVANVPPHRADEGDILVIKEGCRVVDRAVGGDRRRSLQVDAPAYGPGHARCPTCRTKGTPRSLILCSAWSNSLAR